MSEPATYAIEIADAAFDRLKTLNSFFKTFRRTPMLTVQSDMLPALQIYMSEERTPDGDLNHGEVRFMHNPVLNITGTIVHSDDETQYRRLDAIMTAIDPLFWSDPKFVALFEGVERMTRRDVYERIGETPLAHIWLAITFRFRTEWQPNVPDYLERITITTRVGNDGTIAPIVTVIDVEH